MFNKHDLTRNECMLTGAFRNQGYDWWWHSFTARHAESGAEKPFFIEYFLCNPALGGHFRYRVRKRKLRVARLKRG